MMGAEQQRKKDDAVNATILTIPVRMSRAAHSTAIFDNILAKTQRRGDALRSQCNLSISNTKGPIVTMTLNNGGS